VRSGDLHSALKPHVGHMVEVNEDEDGANVYLYCVTCGGPVLAATEHRTLVQVKQ